MAQSFSYPATVVEVVDGDTIKLDLDLGFHISYRSRCRIKGINAPEMGTPEGVAAKDYACTLLKPGDVVTFMSRCLDKYGRPLGFLILPGMLMADFGTTMLEAGHAVVMK